MDRQFDEVARAIVARGERGDERDGDGVAAGDRSIRPSEVMTPDRVSKLIALSEGLIERGLGATAWASIAPA